MEHLDKRIHELKTSLEELHGREFSWEEATKASHDLSSLTQLFLDIAEEDLRRERKLLESPKGFHLEKEGYTCFICGRPASNENSWYDKYGLKCMTCQKAVNQKIIPGSVAKNKKCWYSKEELEMYFNLKGKLLNKCIKLGFLKARTIPDAGKTPHLHLFLLKDNKDVLPPKDLLKSRIVKMMIDGEEYYTSEYWYEYVDEKLAKQISKYMISALFPKTLSQPVKSGRFYFKSVNPLFSF